jgi:uncharacterized membrane protein YjgN (DUF898 family)
MIDSKNEFIKSFKNKFKQEKVAYTIFFASIISFMGLGLVDPLLPLISKKYKIPIIVMLFMKNLRY